MAENHKRGIVPQVLEHCGVRVEALEINLSLASRFGSRRYPTWQERLGKDCHMGFVHLNQGPVCLYHGEVRNTPHMILGSVWFLGAQTPTGIVTGSFYGSVERISLAAVDTASFRGVVPADG